MKSTLEIQDRRTGLTWRRGAPRLLTWGAGRRHCAALEGGAGWRLPTLDELKGTIVPRKGEPGALMLNPEIFEQKAGTAYWSGTPHRAEGALFWWSVTEDAEVMRSLPGAALAVRCVRASAR